MTNSRTCPICKKSVAATAEGFPFCSDRCRTIDLGKWAAGDYKISTPIFDPEELDSLQNDLEHTDRQMHPAGRPKEWTN